MARARAPRSNRILCKVIIGNRAVYTRLKKSTADVLGIQGTTTIEQKKSGVKRGAKGGGSYTLYFKSAQTLRGVKVVSVDFPVDGKTKLKAFYTWAKSKNILGGIRTPWGISYFWDDTAFGKGGTSGGGGGGGGLIPFNPNLGGLGGLVQEGTSALGSYLGGELGSRIGGQFGAGIGRDLGGRLGDYLGDQII